MTREQKKISNTQGRGMPPAARELPGQGKH